MGCLVWLVCSCATFLRQAWHGQSNLLPLSLTSAGSSDPAWVPASAAGGAEVLRLKVSRTTAAQPEAVAVASFHGQILHL